MYQLRNYQSKAKQDLFEKIRQGKRKILVWSGTGTGKGLMMSDLVNDVMAKEKPALSVMRRRELIFQTKANYIKYHNHKPSIIMGNSKGYEHGNLNQICSIDTIRTRMLMDDYQYLRNARLVIVDECHDSNSPTYQRMFEWFEKHNPDCIFVGFTATPFTVGGKPLDFWEDYVQTLTMQEMKDQGFLVPDFHYAPEAKMDTTGLRVVQGDFKEKDLFDRAKDSVLVGDIVATWMKYGQDRPTIMFCVNKEHSMMMTAAFNQRGISCVHIDESTTSKERALAIEGLRSGKYKIMSNIETMTTGVDCPPLSCVIMARATWSEVLYLQSLGRAARPYKVCADCGMEYGADKACIRCKSTFVSFEKKDFIILDHAANAERHGFFYDDRKAQLKKLMNIEELKKYTSKSNRKVECPVTRCLKCFIYVKPGEPCPGCSEVKHVVSLPKTETGELKLIDEAMANKLRLNQMLSQYEFLQRKANLEGWGKGKVYFVLHKKYGDLMFKFKTELGVPDWVEAKIWEQRQRALYEKDNGQQ